MIIGVDLDGCLSDFNQDFVEKVVEVTKKDLWGPRPYVPKTWNYPEAVGYTKDDVGKVWDHIKQDRKFWSGLNPYDGVADFLSDLEFLQHDVYFVSSRPGVNAKRQTEDWLRHNGYSRPTVLISSEKGLVCRALNVDLYLDDKTENCEDVRDNSNDRSVYMLAQPWNRPIHGVPRIPDLNTFLNAVRRAM